MTGDGRDGPGRGDAPPEPPSARGPERSRSAVDGSTPRILLLIDRDANRKQLADLLSEWYTVDAGPDGPLGEAFSAYDLCLLDEESLRQHRETLEANRDASAPVFFPYLLVRTDRPAAGRADNVRAIADDVIDAPVRRAELRARIEALLRTRAYSIELDAKKERLEAFAGVVSHDLRNPLNVAQARLDLAARECDSEHLTHVERAHERMEALIADLLTLAREGESVTEFDRVDPAAVAEKAWALVETPHASLVVDSDREVMAAEGRLQQLFENLMRNAVEHGGDRVTVTVGTGPGTIYIEDDGAGIDDADPLEVFEAGYSTNDGGTGLGLSIVNRIVEAHGWEISVTESSDGVRFEITNVEFAEA